MYPSSMASCWEDMASSESISFTPSLPQCLPMTSAHGQSSSFMDSLLLGGLQSLGSTSPMAGVQQRWPRACLHHHLAATPSFSSPTGELTPSARLFGYLAGGEESRDENC